MNEVFDTPFDTPIFTCWDNFGRSATLDNEPFSGIRRHPGRWFLMAMDSYRP